LIRGFSAQCEDPSIHKLNISNMIKHDETLILKKIYKDIDMQDLSNDNGEFADNHGYLGKNH